MKKKIILLVNSKLFWINLVFTLFSLFLIQLLVHFGFKFGFFSEGLEHYFYGDYAWAGSKANTVYWTIPFKFEIFIYLSTFILFSWFTSSVVPSFTVAEKKINGTYGFLAICFKIFVVFFGYAIFADPRVSRLLFFSLYNNQSRENYIIDCEKSLIKFKSHEVIRKSPLCNWCDEKEKKCIYKGLDSFEPLQRCAFSLRCCVKAVYF